VDQFQIKSASEIKYLGLIFGATGKRSKLMQDAALQDTVPKGLCTIKTGNQGVYYD
jgi:hypothetical protein